MTDLGRDRVDAAISELLIYEDQLLDGLSTLEQERLTGLLRKLSLDFD
jgi:DNA-binding MarR family transcriptional regulator